LANGTILILGGAGMVGLQVAREAARELDPKKIVIAARTEREAREGAALIQAEIGADRLVLEWGDIFHPESLKNHRRADIVADVDAYDELFNEIFASKADHRTSALFQLIERYQPDVVVDCINTATGISYQNEFTIAQETYEILRAVENGDSSRVPQLLRKVRELLISQGVPQIARHILILHRALEHSNVRVYVKVGTTGTGGMGINIPYTHSEDKPSMQLLGKSAIGFAHTGLLFLLARTPSLSEENHGAIVKEVKPGAMIGFRSVGRKPVKVQGQEAYLIEPRVEELGDTLQLRDGGEYRRMADKPLEITTVDTGENGLFSIGEFQAITYPRQMEYVTPEEVARTVVLEILGASTGRDVLAAIDSAITEPSYRAGVLREHAIRAIERLERERPAGVLPSIAIGQLGPPKLSKLLAEAHLIHEAAATDDIDAIREIPAADMQRSVELYIERNPLIVSEIVTIGVPMLREKDGKLLLTRGPRVSIPPPPPHGTTVSLDSDAIEKYAATGWVDLRVRNFELWRERLRHISTPDIEQYGYAALDVRGFPARRFVPGDIVGWLFTNEPDEQGMIGRRLF